MRHLVAIPSRARVDELLVLINFLKTYGHGDVVVYDNGYSDEHHERISSVVETVDARGWKFYKMWNDAWQTAYDSKFDAVVLLNDDIELHPESIEVTLNILMSNDSRGMVGMNYRRPLDAGCDMSAGFKKTKGTYKDGGIWGCAFAVRAAALEKVPLIDERYNIWYGDDELVANMQRAGYETGIALGAPVLHEGSVTTNMFPELVALTGEDQKLFLSKGF